jgi:TRAP-type mannitol/chloroaromatic compound transport system permease small subunit
MDDLSWFHVVLAGMLAILAVCQYLDKKQSGSTSRKARNGPRATIWGWIVLGGIVLFVLVGITQIILRFSSYAQ